MHPRAKLDPAPFQLVAGHPVLDFVNTLDWRFRPSGPEELLNDYGDLLRFSEESGLMKASEVRRLAKGEVARKKRILSTTKKLRECLASTLYAIADRRAPQMDKVKSCPRSREQYGAERILSGTILVFGGKPTKIALAY